MNKGKDLLDFWSMVLKSIISSWEGTISCKIWKIKDKTQIGYFNVKTFENFYLTKKSTGFRALGAFSSENWAILVLWYFDIKNGSLGPSCTFVTLLCDTIDEIPWWPLTNTACGKYNFLKEQPKSISSVPFFEGKM